MSWGFLLCATSGTVTFLIGLHNALLVRRLHQQGIRTSGLVVDQTRESHDAGPYWKPVISFTDQHGNTVTFQPGVGGKGYELPTGRKVPVVYLADNPEKVKVDMRRFTTSEALFLLSFGGLLLSIAVALLLGS
jgi:hypothetical protein